MNFTFNMGSWNAVFAVPSDLVDKHLKLAGKAQLGVILWILRHAGDDCTSEQLAQALGLSDDDTEDAIQYWIDCGLLCRRDTEITPASPVSAQTAVQKPLPASQPAEGVKQEAPKAAASKKKKSRPRPDGMYLAARLEESPQLRELMQEAENCMGKTLSPALSCALLMFHEDYGLPPEVILMMLHYACDIGKTGTAYIESLAKDWAESEIFTIDAAEQKLKDLDEQQQAWKRLESVIGIYHRAPSKKEASFAYTWVKEWATCNELIAEAYERCVDRTGKLSLKYMNSILENWYKNGIRTSEALAAHESGNQDAPRPGKSYDLDELESLSFFNPVEE